MTAALDVRQHILDVAHPLFLQKGFTAVGLAEVLTAARVPKGSFYHYFGSKEAFGEAVLDGYFDGYLAHVDALLAEPGSAADRLVAFFQDWLESQTGDAESRCLAVKLGAEVCDLSETMRQALERGVRGVTERLADRIEAGRADGSVTAAPGETDAGILAVALYQAWLGAGLVAKITRDRAPLDAAMAETRRRLGLTPRP